MHYTPIKKNDKLLCSIYVHKQMFSPTELIFNSVGQASQQGELKSNIVCGTYVKGQGIKPQGTPNSKRTVHVKQCNTTQLPIKDK